MKKNQLITIAAAILAAPALFAVGDPDFEQTKPQELPLWSGAKWAKASEKKFTAQIVNDAQSAASGKQYLHVENPAKQAVWVMAYPSVNFTPGYGVEITCKMRGGGASNFGLNIYGKDGKLRPWRPATCLPYTKKTQQWQEFKLRYVPIEGDDKFMLSLGVREGNADWDDVKVTPFKLEK